MPTESSVCLGKSKVRFQKYMLMNSQSCDLSQNPDAGFQRNGNVLSTWTQSSQTYNCKKDNFYTSNEAELSMGLVNESIDSCKPFLKASMMTSEIWKGIEEPTRAHW